MKITIDNEDYRLYFRYRTERPVWPIVGKRDIRSAQWKEVMEDQIRDRADLRMSDFQGDDPKYLRSELYRTVEAVLEKLTSEVDEKGRQKGIFVASGISRCSPLDSYKKETGRQQAFDRLKNSAVFTGLQKRQLFVAFANRGASELEQVDRTIAALTRYREKLAQLPAIFGGGA